MKKIFVLLAVAFVFVSCDDGGMETTTVETNPFIGTWEAASGHRTIFTATGVTNHYPNGDIYWTGAYTYNDTHITVALDQAVSAQEMVDGWGETEVIPYSFDGDILIFYYTNLTKIND